MPKTVYFNEGTVNLSRPLAAVRAAQAIGEFRIVCSSSRRQPAVERSSDFFEVEPRGLDDTTYVEWCLDFVRRHSVEVFLPGRRSGPLANARPRFESLGVSMLSLADRATLSILGDKVRTYERLASLPISIPAYAAVNSADEFTAALNSFPSATRVCYKPTVSMYGIGFKIISPSARSKRPRAGSRLVDPATAITELTADGRFSQQIMMEYLGGPERSVDCLAWKGELIRCVIRRKSSIAGEPQIVEDHAEIEGSIRHVAKELGLHGLFNAQFRDSRGRSFLLEINARMSGGVHYSSQAGIALPYWAIRLAAGGTRIDEIPFPRIGTRIDPDEIVASC